METVHYWSDIADLTHKTQVAEFGWCSCEEQEHLPYDDCPRAVLCGECSDSLDDWAEWADAVQDIPAHDRIPCSNCGQ